MNYFFKSVFPLLITLFIYSCNSTPDRPWQDAVPDTSPFIIIPEENATLHTVLESDYMPFLDDITSSAVQLVSQVDSSSNASLPLTSIVLYPGTRNQLETIWMTQSSDEVLKTMQEHFYENFTQNRYFFHDVTIHKLHIQERLLFAAQLNDILMFSESSLGIENAIRAYLGRTPRADLSGLQLEPGHIIMNTSSLDSWVEQMAQVSYRPVILNAFRGTRAAMLSVSQEGAEQKSEFELSGLIPLSEESPTEFIASFSSQNGPVTLDRYIPSNTAGFGILRLPPRLVPPDSVAEPTELDTDLMDSQTRYAKIAKTLGNEFGMVLFTESGFLSSGEHLFLRKVKDISALRTQLNNLANDNLITASDGVYFVRSEVLAKMIGSELCSFNNFYLDLTGDVLVISKRKGLTEMVESDRNRRRVIYYESTYRDLKEDFPGELSGFFVATNDFYSFLEPFLSPDNYVSAITSKFDLLAASTQLNEDENNIAFNLRTYRAEERTNPYEEQWLVPIGGSELTGEPVLADIGGSPRDEIIFATQSGRVYALAADGTVALQLETDGDTPVGSPVVYDWYGTGQNVILLAAGNKVYGWNDNGEALPRFPFTLDEQITTPLLIEDITRNGLPEAMVATADRRLHILTNRGENRPGWPVTTNTVIESKPTVAQLGGSRSIIAFASNAIHAWQVDGSSREGYPKFINATISGSPFVYKNNILAGGADGYLYSIGPNRLFADSLNAYSSSSEASDIEAAYVSNSSLSGTPAVYTLTIESEDETYNEPMILTMGSNGSVFLISEKGQLRFTQNMGQPAAGSFSPFVTDLDSDNERDVVALANFGRLYAWQVSNGERIYSIPTTGMQWPIIADINGNGYKEIIAQTSQGLRCWTIYGE